MTIVIVYILQDMTIATVYIFTSGHDHSNCVYILQDMTIVSVYIL